MRYTQEDYDELCKAIATGVRSTSYNGNATVMRPLDEMLKIKRMMEKQLGIAARRDTHVVSYYKTRKNH